MLLLNVYALFDFNMYGKELLLNPPRPGKMLVVVLLVEVADDDAV
jgi:hypothetical protein